MTLPKFLRDAEEAKRQHPQLNGRAGPIARPGSADAYARSAFAAELSELAAQTEPGRNDRLNEAGFNLAQLVASGHLDRDSTWNALYGTALAIGLEPKECADTLRSAFRAGEAAPREVPELELIGEPTVIHRPQSSHGGQEAQNGASDEPGEDGQGEAPLNLRERFPALDWAELWEREDEEEWIVEPLLPARRLVALFSPPKVGKSLLMLELAVGIARGVAVLGSPEPDRPRRVLYVDHENDPTGDVRTRLQAMGLKPDQLDNLVYLSFPAMAYLDTFVGGAELLAVAQEYGVEVVVIDTISRAVGGEENDNDTWLGFYRNTGRLLKSEGIAVIRLDHTGKDQSKGMRGGSAKYGDVDLAWSMTMPAEDTLLLECVAHRLPVPEKLLTINRERLPLLRHTVSTEGRVASWDARLREAAELLDALVGKETQLGVNEAHRKLRAHGKGMAKARVVQLIHDRDLRFNASNTLDGEG